ncbi:motility associated factor glycosyltransferase family protein, partial [Curvivirga aplysinae]|uniref:hypothetical protein n=1 Tax=Curvivirga aplysinae TaxID=2529852 RepID=UPI001C3F73E9
MNTPQFLHLNMKKHIISFYNCSASNLRKCKQFIQYFPERLLSEIEISRLPKDFYQVHSFDDLLQRKRSDTIFIFGSGGSISDINAGEWAEISKHNTLSFNNFFVQKLIDIDYHIVREIGDVDFIGYERNSFHKNIADVINSSPYYENSVFCFQRDWQGWAAKFFVGSKILRRGTKIFPFKNKVRGFHPPTDNIKYGLTHGPGTLTDCINLAYLLGFKDIVLCGVDLNDRRYFWMKPDMDYYEIDGLTIAGGETSANTVVSSEPHRTANSLIPFLQNWRNILAQNDTTLYVQNPNSVLNE